MVRGLIWMAVVAGVVSLSILVYQSYSADQRQTDDEVESVMQDIDQLLE